MRVTILRGISGSGKSTWASAQKDAAVFSADHYFGTPYKFDPSKLGDAHGYCLRRFAYALETGDADHVIVDNTNTRLLEIAPYLAFANAYHAQVEIREFRVPLSAALKRGIHGVGEGTLNQQAHNLAVSAQLWPKYWPKVVVQEEQ